MSVISFTKNALIVVCYRETPELCRPTSVTRRSGDWGSAVDTRGRTVVYRDAPGHTRTHRSASGATPGMHRRKP